MAIVVYLMDAMFSICLGVLRAVFVMPMWRKLEISSISLLFLSLCLFFFEFSQDDELSFDVYCYNVQPGYALDYLTGAASKG